MGLVIGPVSRFMSCALYSLLVCRTTCTVYIMLHKKFCGMIVTIREKYMYMYTWAWTMDCWHYFIFCISFTRLASQSCWRGKFCGKFSCKWFANHTGFKIRRVPRGAWTLQNGEAVIDAASTVATVLPAATKSVVTTATPSQTPDVTPAHSAMKTNYLVQYEANEDKKSGKRWEGKVIKVDGAWLEQPWKKRGEQPSAGYE